MPTDSRKPAQLFQIVLLATLSLFLAVETAAAQESASNEIASLTTRPDAESGPTKVFISLFVLDISDIDGAAQSFTANVFIRLRWRDERLSDPNAANRTYDLSDVWNPRIQIFNQQKLWKTFPEIVDVTSDGTVTYRQRYFGQFSQPLNLSDFPFDSHEFSIELVPAGFREDEITLVPDSNDNAPLAAKNLTIADWKIQNPGYEIESHQFGQQNAPLPMFRFTFHASRYLGYYIFRIFVPLVMIIIMSWVVFWIDPTTLSTKISVSVTSMLTLIAYRFTLASSLPKLSYLTRMDIFMLSSTFIVFAALIEVTTTNYLTSKGKEAVANRLDSYARWIFPLLFILLFSQAFAA